jgi:Tol biopolymer transport system component/DNA-binding winged helix-turn-helix (wHTH) protein
MRKENGQCYEFGPFLMDLDERLLMRDGRVVPLPPKVFDTLLALVKNNGRVMSKDELMQTLWPDTFVEESNLTQNISQIRRALGDGAAEAQYIETIPKRGYRFVAPVQRAPSDENGSALNGAGAEVFNFAQSDASLNGSSGDSIVAAPPNRKKTLTLAALLCAVLALIAAAVFVYRRANTHAGTAFLRISPSRLTTSGKAGQAAMSRDGKYVAYVVEENNLESLWVRQVATTGQTMVVAAAAVRFKGVTFSPDDNFIYYVAYLTGSPMGELYQVPVLGGTPKKIMPDVDSPVSFAPDGQSFAFVRVYPQQRETALLTARVDGSAERKLVTRKRPEMLSTLGTAWSPDGKLIACAAGVSAGGDASMHVLAVSVADGTAQPIGAQTWTVIGQVAWLGDGSGVVISAWRRTSAVYGDQLWLLSYPKGEARRVTNDMTSYEGVSISADSTKLISRRTDRVSRIWIVPASGAGFDTTKATQIQSGFGDNYSERFGLDWTPDGRLVYATHSSGNLDIWLTTTDGKQQKQLTRDPLTDIFPAVSADGRHVVFVSERSGSSNIWRMDIDGGDLKQLTSGKGDYHPTLSPDGQWVIYSSWNSGQSALWKAPIDGGEPTQLSSKLMARPLVSPDGKWIVCYYQSEKDNRNRIALLPFAGGEPVIVEPMATPEFGIVRWSPDSRALTYIATRNGVSNLWSQPIDGGAARQLTDFNTDQIFRFAWSRDGKYLACERGLVINDVVLLSSVKAE